MKPKIMQPEVIKIPMRKKGQTFIWVLPDSTRIERARFINDLDRASRTGEDVATQFDVKLKIVKDEEENEEKVDLTDWDNSNFENDRIIKKDK